MRLWSIRASGGVLQASAPLRLDLLLLFLTGGRRRLLGLGRLVDPLLELLHARAERPGELGQPVGAEEDQHDHQDDQQFLIAQAKHVRLLFSKRPPPYARAQPPRKTLRSPTRVVTRRESKNSSSGMAYFREIPSRSLMSPGPISFRSRSMVTSLSWMASSAWA